MKRSIAVRMALAASMLAAAPSAFAQWSAPEISPLIGHYRFLPRLSTLNESGGFAGRDTDFRVFGEFELWDASRDPHTDAAGITFRNIEAWASHPILAYVLDLDETLALSDLWGEQLPVAGPFDAYRFRGETGDGSTVHLYAVAFGPWLGLHGGTTPPPGSADYFTYQLDAVARRGPLADLNDDGVVDGKDLASIVGHIGQEAAGNVGFHSGDADGDGIVDGSDFLAWQRQVGDYAPPTALLGGMMEQVMAVAAAGGVAVQAIPEPASLALLVAAGAVCAARVRRQS